MFLIRRLSTLLQNYIEIFTHMVYKVQIFAQIVKKQPLTIERAI